MADLDFPQSVNINQLPYYYTLNKNHGQGDAPKQLYEIPGNVGEKRRKDFLIFFLSKMRKNSPNSLEMCYYGYLRVD